ncbi:hypothetical protein HU200_023438 [Digitaria exilis]|uniref:Uncharacterized protein n=1 Tax=Digitaria exilis TaxID=1010633 RepID=A0A835CCT8_9POAL|nr:hypothetical protein HU200_023438 [Digitaria exilis]
MEGIATAGPARRNSPSNPINLSMEPGWIQERQQLFAGLSGRVAGRPRASLSMILSAPPGYYTCSDSRPNGGPTWPRRIGDKAPQQPPPPPPRSLRSPPEAKAQGHTPRMAAARSLILRHLRLAEAPSSATSFRPAAAAGGAVRAAMDSEVTDRIIKVVKNFQKIDDPSKVCTRVSLPLSVGN